MMRQLMMTTCLMLGLTPAWADDAALLIGIERYDDLDRVVQGSIGRDVAVAMDRAGFAVIAGNNSRSGEMTTLLEAFQIEADSADRLIVALNGRFATDGARTWMLARDANDPQLMTVAQEAASVDSLMLLMAQAPGQAVLLLAADESDNSRYDTILRAGIGTLNIPQGVTVIITRPQAVDRLLEGLVDQLGVNVIDAVRRTPRARLEGYVPDSLTLLDRDQPLVAPVVTPRPLFDFGADQALWAQAETQNSAQGYAQYIDRFPRGVHVAEARKRLDAIRAEPNRDARLAEEALALDRDARRSIQRDLNVMNFSTRGIDGIFGPGTRQAVTNWQQQNGFAQTSYLTSEQIIRLEAQAARRAAEREAEAERQRAAAERADRAFWEESGAGRSEPGLRSYLERFPDGLFAGAATQRLREVEQAKRQEARAEERRDWDRARTAGTLAAFRGYLEVYPQGMFRDEALEGIREREAATSGAGARNAAEQIEGQLNLDPLSRRLIEARLQELGLEPGRVDGEFDRDTRRAIRNYQRDRGVERTGYLDPPLVSQLLTSAFR